MRGWRFVGAKLSSVAPGTTRNSGRRKLCPYAILLFLILTGCGPSTAAGPQEAPAPSNTPQRIASAEAPSGSKDLIVFAAASLTEAFAEIGRAFESQNPGVSVGFNFGGSQQLAQQLSEGAPADVFASANQKQMEAVVQSGRIDPGTVLDFAKNKLVVIYPKDNQAGLSTLQDLAQPGLRLVLAAEEVPVGQYSLDFLERAAGDPAYGESYRESVLNNVVSYEENVKAVLSKVALGEADGGIVYTSDISGDSAGKVGQVEIPEVVNRIASYPIAPVEDSSNPDLSKAFIDYVLSNNGQGILARYGFISVEG